MSLKDLLKIKVKPGSRNAKLYEAQFKSGMITEEEYNKRMGNALNKK